MRLEVLVDQQEPLIFPLNKEKIVIGSGENCDIMLDAEGISRKHVILHCGQDEFYIIDQGSTNGTFINEERLVPGKRVEFTSFFPVRLGTSVLLTLLSDEESDDMELSSFNMGSSKNDKSEDDDSTRVISQSSLQDYSSLSINLHRKKASVRAKKASSKKDTSSKKSNKKDSNFHLVTIFAAVLIIGAIYYQLNKEEEKFDGPTVVTAVTAPAADAKPVEAKPLIEKVEKEFIKTLDEVASIKADFKCVSDVEKEVCKILGLQPPHGATQVGRDLFIFFPISFKKLFIDRLNEIYPDRKEEAFPVEAYLSYFLDTQVLPTSEEYDDYRFHLYFLGEDDKILAGVSFYPKSYKEFKKESTYKIFEDFLWGGQSVLEHVKNYFTYH